MEIIRKYLYIYNFHISLISSLVFHFIFLSLIWSFSSWSNSPAILFCSSAQPIYSCLCFVLPKFFLLPLKLFMKLILNSFPLWSISLTFSETSSFYDCFSLTVIVLLRRFRSFPPVLIFIPWDHQLPWLVISTKRKEENPRYWFVLLQKRLGLGKWSF